MPAPEPPPGAEPELVPKAAASRAAIVSAADRCVARLGFAPRLREVYRHKRDVMERAIRRELGDLLTWPAPKGGFFLWATLPEGLSDTSVLERALDERLVFVIGSAFYVDGQGHDKVRLSFSAPTPERIEEGVRRLARVVKAVVGV